MNVKPSLIITAISLGIGVFAPQAKAALITGVTVSTDMGNFDPSQFDLDATVNGVGLPGNTPALTGIHAAFTSTPPNIWAGNQATGNITFDLNDTYDLAGFSFWNYNNASTIGIQGVTVQSSTDGINFTTIPGAPTVFQPTDNPEPEVPEQFSFTPVTASFVQFIVNSNYGNPVATGFAVVQFDGTLPTPPKTPEPTTLLSLMLFGGGLFASKSLANHRSKK